MKNNLVKQELVFEKRGDVFTTSEIISQGAEINHKVLKRNINKYRSRIERYGKLLVLNSSESTGGRKETFYVLNEMQSSFLLTLLHNTDSVLDFKQNLIDEFFKMREFIQHKQSEEYKHTMLDSKNEQKKQMSLIGKGQPQPRYIKACTIANKAVSIAFDLPKMIKKEEMTAEMLAYHTIFLQKAVALMTAQKMGVEIPSVSKLIYSQIPQIKQLLLL